MIGIGPAVKAPWTPRPDRGSRLRSAVLIAEFAVDQADLDPRHRAELLSLAAWKATELDGKWKTRFRTVGVVEGPTGTPINHEHVVPRLVLRGLMLDNPGACREILSAAIACVVTTAEHALLDSAPPEAFGWARYEAVGLWVLDMADGSAMNLTQATTDLSQRLALYLPPGL